MHRNDTDHEHNTHVCRLGGCHPIICIPPGGSSILYKLNAKNYLAREKKSERAAGEEICIIAHLSDPQT